MLRSKMFPLLLIGALTLGGASTALADEGKGETGKEAGAVLAAKVSLSQAIIAAEQATGGKSYAAEVENKDGQLLYEVKTAAANGLQRVEVDSGTGKVVATKPIDTGSESEGEQDE